jgi:hypothetical protein
MSVAELTTDFTEIPFPPNDINLTTDFTTMTSRTPSDFDTYATLNTAPPLSTPSSFSNELLSSDRYGPVNPSNNTYNRQEAINRFELRDKLQKQANSIVLRDKGFAPPSADDLLTTNNLDVSFTNENTLAMLPNNQRDRRYYQEVYRIVGVNSRQRQKYNERPVVAADRINFPNKEIWDEFFNSVDGSFNNINACCVTFNNILGFTQEFPNYFIKNCQLWFREPINPNTNQYSILLQPPPRHIRYVRLRSVETPLILNVVNKYNNLLLLDVINPCTGKSFEYTTDNNNSLGFALLLIPIGRYTVAQLVETIVALLNTAAEFCCEPFSGIYNENTGEITFNCEYSFHLKFWFSTLYPQFNLFEMLGFKTAFPVDSQGNTIYVNSWTNLVDEPSPLTSAGLVNKVPFRFPNLDVHEYIYLAIRFLNVITDAAVATDTDVFAKVLLKERFVGQNLINTSKVFLEPLDKIERLDIQWLDAYGNLVDFGGQENSFMLEFVVYQDKLKDSDFSTLRGISNYDPNVDKVVFKSNPN